jgi:alkylated DNA nucleotide flippase Atl1
MTARAEAVRARVRAIPEGFVSAYSDLDPEAPRFAGSVLAAGGDDLPWWRVVRKDGSLPKGDRQRAHLDAEGVPFRGARVDMKIAHFGVSARTSVQPTRNSARFHG